MEFAVVDPAQRHGEFVTHLQSHSLWLGEFEVVRVSRVSPTDQARLRGHEFEVRFIAQSTRFAERQLALVDLGGNYIDLLVY